MTEMFRIYGRKARGLLIAGSLPILALALCLPPSIAGPLPSADGESAPLPDPFPLRRLLISPERIHFELQRASQGALVQMNRAEFEGRVAEAARAREAMRNPPRLVEAHYRATLVNTALVGTAEWTVGNPSPVAGILPLQPFNLALRQAEFNKRPAVLGNLEGKFGLWVEAPGTRTLSIGWSARGDLGPGGLRFDLKLPSCVRTAMDLELPADCTATIIGDTGLLSAAQPASRADHRIWRLFCNGASPIDLLIRPTSAANEPPPLVLARLKTTQKLAPDLVEADYDFSLEVLHGGIRQLLCEGDPALHVTAVSMGGAEIETWEVRPGPTAGAPFQLWIGLPERFQGSYLPLQVHGFASPATTDRWTSPALRLKNAVFQGETLQLQIAAGMQLEDWRAGEFNLVKAAEVNDVQTLTLESGLANGPHGAGEALSADLAALRAQRPSARLRTQKPEYRVRQMAWWQIGSDSSSLTVQIDYEMVRGRLFRLPVLLPADWSVDRVELSPTELFGNWTPMPSERGQTLLIAELRRPLETPTTARLTLQLRPANARPDSSQGKKAPRSEFTVPFPEIVPQGTRLWEGALALRIDPLYETVIHASLPSAIADRRNEDRRARSTDAGDVQGSMLQPLSSILNAFPSPWGAQPPDYLYTFRGQGVSGTLGLRPRSARVRARCTSEIVLASGRAAVLIRLLLQPDVGNPDTIDLLVSAPVGGKWKWHCEGGRNAVLTMQRLTAAEMLTPLLSLGAGTALSAAGLFHPPFGRASWWRLTLAQPLREPLLLETTFDLLSGRAAVDRTSRLSALAGTSILEMLALNAAASVVGTNDPQSERWEVPLLGVLSAQHMVGEVQLYLAGTGKVDDIERDGLTEVATSPGAGVSIPWHTFRYSRLPVSLVLLGRITAPERPTAAWVERAHLTTYVEPGVRLLNYFTFQIRNWKQRTLPLRLPTGARPLATKLNGRWLAPLRLDETAGDGPVVQLPVVNDSPLLQFEVVYALDHPAGTLWTQVRSPMPGLPVIAVASGRTWCLPAGWMPLYEGPFQRHPGPSPDAGEQSPASVVRLAWLADATAPFASEDWRHRQERLLAEADTYLQARRRENKQRSLGQALHDLIYNCLKDQKGLVLDAVALQEAGLGPATPIRDNGLTGKGHQASAPAASSLHALEDVGLVCIPCRPAPLLTTRRQWAAWQGPQGQTSSVSASVEMAVADAIRYSHDPSGRFRDAASWLRDRANEHEIEQAGETGPGKGDLALSGTLAAIPHPEPWTEWEPIAGAPGNERIVVLRQEALWGVSCFLTGMLLLSWWWARGHGARLRYVVALCWLATSLLGLLWLPMALRVVFWWPILAGVALAAGWHLVAALRSRKPGMSTEASAVASGVLALALAAGLPGYAAAPSPTTVWLLPGPPTAPEQFSVLVPPELLGQLKMLAHRGPAGLQSPLLLGAKYDGTVMNRTADFWVEFPVHCFTDERAMLALPLVGVELQEAFLDGSPAYPAALAAPQSGYGIWLEGRGMHTVRVHFLVRVSGASEDQEVRFSIPELARSQLTFLAPEAARYLRAVVGRGAQQARGESKGVRLEADLGRVSTVNLYWRQELEPPPPPNVKVQEAYYWDLQRASSRLLGLLDYRVSRGALAALSIALPPSLEVRQVELVSVGTGGLLPRLKDWTTSGAGNERRLRLEFQVPVTNQVQILLELVPGLPLTHHAVLSIPTAEGVSFAEGWVAFRTNGLQGTITESHEAEAVEPALFERHWDPAGTEYPGLPESVYHFLRSPGNRPFWRLELGVPAPRREASQDLIWSLTPDRAHLRAEARLKAPAADLAVVEWEVPADVVVAEVRGPNVRNWSRTASRLQVWLQRSLVETTMEMTAWVVRPGNPPTVPFELPCIAFPGMSLQQTSVHLVAETGWELQAEKLNNLGGLPESQHADNELSYLCPDAVYGGVFRLRPAADPAELQSLSWIEIHDRRVAFHASLDYTMSPRASRKLTVRLRNWNGEATRLDAPRRIQVHEGRRNPQTRTWTLELPPDLIARKPQPGAAARHLICQLSGTLTPDSNGEINMPELSVDEAATSEGWLAIIGSGLQPQEQQGLAASADAVSALNRWPAVAGSFRGAGGSVWKIDAASWRLRLRTDFPWAEPSPARLLVEEQATAVLDGRRWLHQATYWLYQESGTHLGILLPNGATLMMASLDRSEITPLQAGSDRLWLPLTGGSGLRALRLRWVFGRDREPLDKPRLDKPYLENILYLPAGQRGPTVWTVHIPPGYQLDYAGGAAIPSNRVELSLNRAAALFRATELAAQHAGGKTDEAQMHLLLTAQLQFNSYCRQAQYELGLPERFPENPLRVEDLASRLKKLLAENREFFHTHQLDTIRLQAVSQEGSSAATGNSQERTGADRWAGADRDDLLARQGTPTYWQLGDEQSGVPHVRLMATGAGQRRQAIGYSGLLLMLLILACTLPAYPRIVGYLWATWPEQFVLLGVLMWLARGEYLIAGLLILAGGVDRLVYVGHWIAARFWRPAPAAAGSGGTSGS